MSLARSSTGSLGGAVAGRPGGMTLLLVIVLAAGLGACGQDDHKQQRHAPRTAGNSDP